MNLWLWHRLRAMTFAEAALHFRRKVYQRQDRAGLPDFTFDGAAREGAFPLAPSGAAPEILRAGLRKEMAEIKGGRITAFSNLPLQVDNPPRWHKDYLEGLDLATTESAFRLNHRKLPKGADIKLIWELSRWYALVRLAMGAVLTPDEEAKKLCVAWLADWEKFNPAYRGWNWTSALESGMRLIQFAWLHALLPQEMGPFAQRLLPAHVHYTWRYRSFGSSANNHLLGELAGLIIAIARWPGLQKWAVPLDHLQTLWEREVLAQFAPDGGNREQALNYHLFSFEFCWQTRAALVAAGHKISPEVEERLKKALPFFTAIQSESDQWDYGDSDSAFVTPLAAETPKFVFEWLGWMKGKADGAAIMYWLGEPPVKTQEVAGWARFPESGYHSYRSADWFLRWDLSPLGYGATAAHGHLDALHVSLWFQGVAFVIDPGTAVYYQNKELRSHLAAWKMHNGPCPNWGDWPKRNGPFLWEEHHLPPVVDAEGEATLTRPEGQIRREVEVLVDGVGFRVKDSVIPSSKGRGDFVVKWHFAPGTQVEQISAGSFRVSRLGKSIAISIDPVESVAKIILPPKETPKVPFSEWSEEAKATVCSSSFRQISFGPVLSVHSPGNQPCVLRTTFLASAP